MTRANEEGGVVLFDGVCNLCNGLVNFLIARDPEGHLRFASLQSEAGRALVRAAGRDPDDLDTMLFVEGDALHARSEAVVRILPHLRAPWRWMAWTRHVPLAVRDPLYRFVAARRYRWFGRTNQCRLPTPELAARFLD